MFIRPDDVQMNVLGDTEIDLEFLPHISTTLISIELPIILSHTGRTDRYARAFSMFLMFSMGHVN